MMKLHKKSLVGIATYLALALWGGAAFAQSGAKPKISIITQWTSGSNGAALNAMGDMFKAAGGEWQDNSVAGFTTDMMNKLRADIIAGNPPAASQLKGPEIKAWSAIGKTVNLDAIVASTDFESVTPKDLAALHRPKGDWISLPLQIYRINTLYLSKKGMDKIGATSPPTTWDEFNAMAEKMKAAGITPITYGGLKWADAMTFEIVLLGISPDAYRKAIMGLDNPTLRGPEVLAAFRQLRKMTGWIDPASAGTHWSTFIPQFMSGQQGMLLMGNWATGNFAQAKFVEGKDYVCAMSPTNDGKPIFDINADGLIFWDKDDPGYKAGQELLARIVMGKEFERKFTQINGSIPVRTDIDLAGPEYTDCQRAAAKNLSAAKAEGRTLLSLGHNMAQPNEITAALTEVLTEFIHNPAMKPEDAQKQLAEAAAASQ